MSIEWLRDLIICIFGLAATVALIFIAVLVFLFYRQVRSMLYSIKATTTRIHGISSYVGDEVVKPVIEVVALIRGIRQGVETFSQFFKKREGGKNV